MSTNYEERQSSPQSRHVVMMTYPQVHILDVDGPIEFLSTDVCFWPKAAVG